MRKVLQSESEGESEKKQLVKSLECHIFKLFAQRKEKKLSGITAMKYLNCACDLCA
jgi:hypothetical protein